MWTSLNSGAKWFILFAFPLLAWLLFLTGCSDNQNVPAYSSAEAKDDAQAKKVASFIKTCEELGVEGNVVVTLHPGYAGAFTGAMWDTGISLTLTAKLDPAKAQALKDDEMMIPPAEPAVP